MINETRVISAIINNDDIAPALNSANIDSLFTSCGDIWEFVKNYYYKHREVVPKDLLEEVFPDFSVVETSGATKHYIEQLTQEFKSSYLERIARGLAKDIGTKSNEELISALNSYLGQLNKISNGVRDLDITDYEKAMDHYSKTQVLMEENGGVLGIRTGYDSIDVNYPTGLYSGHYVMLLSRTNQGKRIRVDEPIPTPTGWTTMGELTVGDKVFGRDGLPCNVVAVSEIDLDPCAYKIIFSDGVEIEADLDHQWLTTTHLERRRNEKPSIRTTKEILATLKHNGRSNHAVPMNKKIDLPEQELLMDPYVFGLWLGDGSKNSPQLTLNMLDWSSIETQLINRGFKYHRVASQEKNKTGCVSVWLEKQGKILRDLNVENNKHIPMNYLRGSIDQRMDLLRGLMDSDGSANTKDSNVEICFTNKKLAENTSELIRSLGIRVNCIESDAVLNGKVVGSRWRMRFTSNFCPFIIPRKANRWKPAQCRSNNRVIKDVVPVNASPMRCITVDSADHTYVAGKNWIVTHNSWIALDIAINAWAQMKRVLFVSLEMSSTAVRDRAYTFMSQGQFSMSELCRAQIDLEEISLWTKANLKSNQTFVVSSSDGLGGLSPAQLQAKIDQYAPDVVFVDYLQLMSDNRGSTGETERIRNVSKELKELAMLNEIPIVAVVSASSNETKEYNNPPQIYEVASSRQAAFDADLVLSLIGHKQADGTSLLEMVARKNRNGPLFDFILKMDIAGGKIVEVWDENLIVDD